MVKHKAKQTSSKVTKGYCAALTFTFAALATQPHTAQAQIKMEKCYGVVKAGKNDCRAADGSHSCASYSKTDASPFEWMSLPAGTCDKIVGATLIPPQIEEEEEF